VKVATVVTRLAGVVIATLALLGVSCPPAHADRFRDAQWYLKALRVTEAQNITKGAGMTVAVVDSGVMAGHPDLKGAVLPGRDVLTEGGDARTDPRGHGTEMAGIIAARGHGGSQGLLGLAPDAKVLPVSPAEDPLVASQAIEWAADHGARVISMSFAIGGSDRLAAAVKKAAADDIVLIAGAGNDGNGSSADRFPGAYPEVLAVGALDRKGAIADFSTQGPQVGITAPGVDIPVTNGHYTSGYGIIKGTSPATAIVAGAAALIRAKYPALSARQVVERLTSTAVDKGAKGRDDAYGYGELNLMAALTAEVDASPSSPGPQTTDAPVAQPESDDSGSGIPPLLFVGIGGVLLAGVAVAVWRSRRGRTTGQAG
jgi:type VII secretion-associated serine protease mycosin